MHFSSNLDRPASGEFPAEKLVSQLEGEVVLQRLLAVELVEPEHGLEAAGLADVDRPGLVGGHLTAELPAPAAPVHQLEVAVRTAVVLRRLEAAHLEVVQDQL